jgi:hypothetical protein
MRILLVFIECSHNVCGAFCAMGHVVFVEDCPVSKMLISLRLAIHNMSCPYNGWNDVVSGKTDSRQNLCRLVC